MNKIMNDNINWVSDEYKARIQAIAWAVGFLAEDQGQSDLAVEMATGYMGGDDLSDFKYATNYNLDKMRYADRLNILLKDVIGIG